MWLELVVVLPLIFSMVPIIVGKKHARMFSIVGLAIPLVTLMCGLLLGELLAEDLRFAVFMGLKIAWGPLQILLLPVTYLIFISAVISSKWYGRDDPSYYSLMLILCWLIEMVYLAGHIILLYAVFEMSIIVSAILVTYGGREGFEAAIKYIVISFIASIPLVTGLSIILLNYLGSLAADLVSLRVLWILPPSRMLTVAALLLIAGFGVKANLIPFHTWIPDTYTAAPTPVSAAIAGAMPITGVYGLMLTVAPILRNNMLVMSVLMLLGCLSIFLGGLAALTQREVKRALAYSSISQLGYSIIALAASSGIGVIAAIMFSVAHGIAKSLMFISGCAATSSKDSALYESFKASTWSFAAGSLSLIGIPPLLGFIAKLLVFYALIDLLANTGSYLVLVVIVVAGVSTLITGTYSIRRLWQRIFLKRGGGSVVGEESFDILVSYVILLAPLIALGLLPTILDPLMQGILVEIGLATLRG